ELHERREPTDQVAIAVGIAEPPSGRPAAHAEDGERPAWVIPKLLSDEPGGPTLRLRGQYRTERRELFVVELMGQEDIAVPDRGPLGLGRHGLLVEAVEPASHLLELLHLPGGQEVIVQGLTGRTRPGLVGPGRDLFEKAPALRIAPIQEMTAENEA